MQCKSLELDKVKRKTNLKYYYIYSKILYVRRDDIIARAMMEKYLKKNPPINEKMIEVMMSSMGRKPSQKQVKQVMQQMNRGMK